MSCTSPEGFLSSEWPPGRPPPGTTGFGFAEAFYAESFPDSILIVHRGSAATSPSVVVALVYRHKSLPDYTDSATVRRPVRASL